MHTVRANKRWWINGGNDSWEHIHRLLLPRIPPSHDPCQSNRRPKIDVELEMYYHPKYLR